VSQESREAPHHQHAAWWAAFVWLAAAGCLALAGMALAARAEAQAAPPAQQQSTQTAAPASSEPQLAPQAMRFASPRMLWLLLAVPVLAGVFGLSSRARARARYMWAGSLFARLAPGYDGSREWLRVVLFLLGFASVVLALARPQWGGELVMMKRRGIDLMVAVDVSTSMLAEDMRPNRLEQAKREIADLVNRMGGDRVGLIAFAGQAFAVCPLTLDHGTVLLLLDSMNPNSVSTPGTNLQDAIRTARTAFVKEEHKHKALVLVTDGEGHEGDPAREAEQAAEEGVVIYTIGIGSTDGQPIPDRDDEGNVKGYKRDHDGKVVNSRLDETVLRRIAEVTHGRYFRATPRALELGAVFDEMQSLEKKDIQGQLATNYEERYQWPLGLAILLLGAEIVIPNRRRTGEQSQAEFALEAAGRTREVS
jgi:Ca-activated chloride channel family protein